MGYYIKWTDKMFRNELQFVLNRDEESFRNKAINKCRILNIGKI